MIHIAVISDSHESEYVVQRLLQKEASANYIFHLGDGASVMESYLAQCRALVYQVAGNCDFIAACPTEREVTLGGISFLLTHGHGFGVKQGLGRLVAEAQKRGVQFAVFGHTHAQHYTVHNGVHLLNPGSLKLGSYACIDIDDNGIPTVTMKQLY